MEVGMAWAKALKSKLGTCVTSQMWGDEGKKALDPDSEEPEKNRECCCWILLGVG